MQPDVSVIIATYNRRGFLQQAIESCFVENDAIDVEVVVVDDGSTDGTRDFLRNLGDERVRPFFQEHQGAQVARNRGMDEARGWSTKFLDDDDYLVAGMLARQHQLLKSTDADVTYGDVDVIRDGKTTRTISNKAHSDLFEGLALEEVNRLQLAFLFVRSAVDELRWDESLDYLQDVDFMVRAASQRLTCRKVDASVAVHRIHDGPRISDVRHHATWIRRFTLICRIYWKAFQKLSARGPLSPPLRKAAATGLWRHAYRLAPFDLKEFNYWYKRVEAIDSDFLPPRSNAVLTALDRLISPRYSTFLINPLRRAKARLRRLKDTST
jgi:glycosyltransferase involved in cell wall biosynthesis